MVFERSPSLCCYNSITRSKACHYNSITHSEVSLCDAVSLIPFPEMNQAVPKVKSRAVIKGGTRALVELIRASTNRLVRGDRQQQE
ncbi:hypothetical protein E2C01_083010 [Portunus trituberculatus]|uniref:Uncharacterized protein n=1 Tax=Portunus trituberculatus TaxID=210409 RepID=A0A5B7J3D4_PORTR|nr:hypothetical protein [Portunus trituberculatus]